MDSLAKRLVAARERRGLSQAEVARRAGMKQPSYFSLEKGDSKNTRFLVAIADVLGVSPQWLQSGVGQMADNHKTDAIQPKSVAMEHSSVHTKENADINHSSVDIDIRNMPRDLPIYGSAACGENGVFKFNGQTLDHVRRPPRLMTVRDAYALYVDGDSLAPWREHGDLVYVHPHLPVKVMDYVVIQLRPTEPGEAGAAYIKRLLRRTQKELHLLQYNPKREITLQMKDVGAIHKILDWSELMGI